MRKNIFISYMLSAFYLLISACYSSQTKDINAKVDSTINHDKILIVYLSRTNNTKAIAEIIHKNVGGTLVALELEKPYPANYEATVQQVVKENETGYLPPLKTKIDSIKNYDVVNCRISSLGYEAAAANENIFASV